MYYLRKRYFVPHPLWVRVPLWEPIGYETWAEVADAYIRERLSNVRALGVSGYPAEDLDIEYAKP